MALHIFDPTHELKAAGIRPAPRPLTLEGKTVGIITNGKEGTRPYFTRVERLLRDELGVADVVWRQKKNYSAPAEAAIIDEARQWHAAVTGVGD